MSNNEPVDHHTPRDAAMSRESAPGLSREDELRLMEEGVVRFLLSVFKKGCDVFVAFPRFCTQANMVRPDIFSGMSMAQRAAIFGQGKAAECAREKLIKEKLLRVSGYRSLHLPKRKSDAARKKYAKAQQGNRNRTKKISAKKKP